jgi:hypothetical protein
MLEKNIGEEKQQIEGLETKRGACLPDVLSDIAGVACRVRHRIWLAKSEASRTARRSSLELQEAERSRESKTTGQSRVGHLSR